MIQAGAVVQRVQQLLRTSKMDQDQLMTLLQTRYEHLYETFGWSTRKRELIVSVVAQVSSTSSDTVTVNEGSATVTSAGTPFTAAMDGRMIQIGDEPTPFFLTFSTTAIVTLQDGEGTAVLWPRANDTAASWRVFQTLYTMPAAFDSVLWLGTDVPLREYDGGREALNLYDPNRQTTDSQPLYWMHAGWTVSTTDPRRQIELWPVPTQGRILKGEYQREASATALTSTSLIDLPTPILVNALLADAHGALYSLTGDTVHKDGNLFYERKHKELMMDYGPVEQGRQSMPRTFGRSSYRGLRGDWLANHQDLSEFPGGPRG